jgi:protein-tyrosine phosphatase
MRFAEIHFHLLPGVDDGPQTMEESVALARAAVADGTGIVVTTPHVIPTCVIDPGEITARTRELSEALRRAHAPLQVLPGGELAHPMVERLAQHQLDQIAQGPPGRRWLLLETPFSGPDESFAAAADELRSRSFGIVIAHPERTELTPQGETILNREVTAGSVLQLTAGALTGFYGDAIRHTALRLLRSATPRVVIASDAHGRERPPMLTAAVAALAAAGETEPDQFAAANPRNLLDLGLATWPAARVA